MINRYGFNSDGHEVNNLRKFNLIIFVKTCLDLATFFKRYMWNRATWEEYITFMSILKILIIQESN